MLAAGDIREKRPGDFVTAADIAAERALARRLPEAVRGAVVLGEEAVHENPERMQLLREAAPVWVVDPVDGTANFARGAPGFGVIVALVQQGVVNAGWIYDPLGDVMVTAERGSGSWSAGARLAVDPESEPARMVGAAYGRTVKGERAGKALAASGRVATVRNLGCSALEYVAVARGAAHFSLHSRSLPWDHAAGMLIVAEAGGIAAFFDGTAYDPRVADRAVLAAASRAAWDTVLGVLGALA
jgi:fructose-1,6-bisphosphatase/inositol monophosphatase family enzyme